MWQRFTKQARQAVFYAQEEAVRWGENYVATEHLLLGLIRDNGCAAARILEKMGLSPGYIQNEIQRQMLRKTERRVGDMQLTPVSKRSIDLAYDEARQIGSNHIGTEHLLLGLIRESNGLAGRVLARLGVELPRVRAEAMTIQQNEASASIESEHTPAFPPIARRIEELKKIITEDPAKWRRKSLVSLFDVSPEQFKMVLHVSAELKALDQNRTPGIAWGYPRTLALLFEKPSLRTRVSFETSMVHLRGHAVYLAPADVGLGVRESVEDVAAVLSRWVDVITARVFQHETIEELAQHSTSPVINALSDREHPVQAFADLLTLQEHKGSLGNHLKLAYVGDGNNVLHALLLACAKTGVNIAAACPKGYGPEPAYIAEAERISREDNTGAQITLVTDPAEAVQDADALYTDVWASMGQEHEKQARAAVFAPYQINTELVEKAKPGAIVLHCLPAHRSEEITAEVMEAHKGPILDQSENRMHTQKALLVLMLGL